MPKTTYPLKAAFLSFTLGVLAASPILLIGCASPAQTRTPSTPATTNPANPASAYVTVLRDHTSGEWEFVPWLRAAGARVEWDADGNDRIFNSPACRSVLIRYLRMLQARLDLIAQNTANVDSTLDAQGANNPYRRQFIATTPTGTFETKSDPSPFITRYMPGSPGADSRGYLKYPNVDLPLEYVNAVQTGKLSAMVTRILMRFDPSLVDADVHADATPALPIPNSPHH